MYQILFILLQAGLWRKRPEELTGFPLSAERWRRLFEEARLQTVTGIVYQGIMMLPEEMMPPQEVMIRWVAEVDRIEQNNHRMEGALKELLAMYRAHGIYPIVMKGQGIAAMYDTPSLRECGDIDLYFDNRQEAEKAVALLRERDIAYEVHADGSLCYTWMEIEVEHHTELVDLQSPKNRKFVARLIKEHGYTQMSTAEGVNIAVAGPLLNLQMMSTHILKHAMGVGIGLRQLCDMARAYHYLHGQIEHSTLREMYAAVGLQQWSELLHAFLVKHIGLPQQLQPYMALKHIDTTPLLHIVREGGNFGQHRTSTKQRSAIGRKWQTAKAFWNNRGLSWKYARKEAFWTVLSLLTRNVERLTRKEKINACTKTKTKTAKGCTITKTKTKCSRAATKGGIAAIP